MKHNFQSMFKRFPFLLVLLASCSGNQVEPHSDDIRQVQIMLVRASTGMELVTGVGTVHYRRETPLAFTSNGKIAKVFVREGDFFKKGQLLAALDLSTTKASLAVAQAALARAKFELDRTKKLFSQGWVTKSQMERAQYDFSVALENVKVESFQLTNAQILAPGSGIVLGRFAEPSQTISAGQAVLLIGEIESAFVLRVALSDRDASRLKLGKPVDATIAALGDRKISAKLIEIGGRSDPATGKFQCLFLLPREPGLRTGQFGEVSFFLPSEATASLTIPVSAVRDVRADEGFVYVVDSANQAELRKVGIQSLNANGVTISYGLAVGERLVVSGGDWIRNGERVKVSASIQ